jgi:3-phosphoshikimate 1-carboxyvinyltransferase
MSDAPAAAAPDVRTVAHAPRLRGVIDVPGDKSITHRALMFNALARGTARVDGFLDSDDTRSTMRCLRALGVRIDEVGGGVAVHGEGRAALTEPDDVLDCGNSGTTMRLMSGILAGLPMLSVLTGDASLRQRPMARIVRPLSLLGARLTARASGTLPPIVIEGGPIRGGQRIETPVASAQVKSAILLASLAADGPVTVVEPTASRDHTERLLAAMGASIDVDGTAITLTPPSDDLRAVDVRVPGDISTAAAWIVAGCIHPDAEICLRGVGVNPSRTGLLDVLQEMGANLDLQKERVIGGEPVADIIVRSSNLRGIEVGGDVVPRAIDELPLIALAGALAGGETVIRDAAELRVKESDRVATTGALLRAMGVQLEERDDGMVVRGGARLSGATVQSHGDHRLAMLGAVAGLIASGTTTIRGAKDVSVSYPEFWRDLEGLRDG